MAVTNFSTLLGLALPTTGDLSGSWGNTVNDSITSLVDSAIAGATTLTSDADVTLTATQGAANQARAAILLCTGARTALRTITAPAASKTYVVINATTGGFGVKIVGVGPTTGVTIPASSKALIAWNGSDFVVVGVTDISQLTGTLGTANGGTNLTSFTSGGAVYATSTSALTTGTLPIGSGGTGATTADAARIALGTETSATGAAKISSGTTAQRDGSPAAGYFRFNTTLNQFEGYNGAAWGAVGSGATGGSNNPSFYENDVLGTANYEIGQAELLTCTISIASPAVITQANSYVAGQPVRFKTTGTLPTGLDDITVYYVSSAGLSGTSFQVSLSSGGASVNTSGTQSGVHSCGKIKNASTAGPYTINSGVTVTVPTGSVWTIV